jgi:hypothetical protein
MRRREITGRGILGAAIAATVLSPQGRRPRGIQFVIVSSRPSRWGDDQRDISALTFASSGTQGICAEGEPSTGRSGHALLGNARAPHISSRSSILARAGQLPHSALRLPCWRPGLCRVQHCP